MNNSPLFPDPDSDDFDRQVESLFKTTQTQQVGLLQMFRNFFGAFFVIWLVWALIVLTAIGGIVWVAVHFISKYW